jgi:hypothetical protein
VQEINTGVCREATRLLKQYSSTLAFHDHRVQSLSKAESVDDFLDRRRDYESVHSDLILARKSYWHHVESHNCRTKIGCL